MSQENVEIVRKGLEALQRRDEEGALEAVAPDFVGRPLSAGIGQDAFHGPEQLREWMLEFFGAWEQAELEILELIDAGEDVIARLRWQLRGRASGFAPEREYSAIYTLRERKIIRYRECLSRRKALEAVGLRD